MSANYNRPKPVDKIGWRLRCTLRVWCTPCNRRMETTLKIFADCLGISYEVRIYTVLARLRCSVCGERPEADVIER